MLGAAELLRMSRLDPHQLALLDILNNSIDQMRGVLSNVRSAGCASPNTHRWLLAG